MKVPFWKSVLIVFGIIAILLTIIPYFSTDYWWIRMFDFPHLQLTFLTLLAILVYFIKFNFNNWKDYVFIAFLAICFVFQFSKIFPYTTFSTYEVLDSSKKNQETLKIYTSNVLQNNDNYQLLINQIKGYDADIVLLTETDNNWLQNISVKVSNMYPYKKEIPLNNTYGMLLYSKLPLINPQVKYLVSDSVPSIHAKIKLSNKDTIQVRAIHPTPPMPQENPKSSDRDTEMMMIAKMALESKYPVIVLGDFNDVAWSVTSQLFDRVSRLIDVRKGRGLFNTYSADNKILRWPLDHIFISSEFRLKNIKRCEDINSDHFPLFTELSFEPEIKEEQEQPYPSKADLKNVEDQIKNFNKNKKQSK